MNDVKAKGIHTLYKSCGWCSATGCDCDAPCRGDSRAIRIIEQHVQHDGRAAQMRDVVMLDRRKDEGGIDAVQANMQPASSRNCPGMAPAIAVEHRQRPEIDRALLQSKR